MSPILTQMNEHTTLLEAFFKAVDALNQQDIAKVQGLLHNDVVLNKIHDQTSTVRGKPDVVKFLGGKMKDHRPELKPISPVSVDSRTGIVRGVAMWEDHEPEGDLKELVDYSFAFTLGPGGWLISNMYASPREPNKINAS